jgi:hypothetical protein
LAELWGVAQLERIETGLQGSLTIKREALEDGEIVLNITGATEGVPSCVT